MSIQDSGAPAEQQSVLSLDTEIVDRACFIARHLGCDDVQHILDVVQPIGTPVNISQTGEKSSSRSGISNHQTAVYGYRLRSVLDTANGG
jgi:hypothetical protein